MRLVVGLGNPGPKYAGNRHNIGFMAADEIVRRHSFAPWRRRFQGEVAEGEIAGEKVLALKPMTYMNESGRAVGEAARFYKIPPEEVLVVYDELDLPLGRVKAKQGGGHGGHNGLRSIDAHLGKAYWRLRLGIGHPGDKAKVTGYVLGDFGKAERQTVDRVLDAVASRVDLLIADRPSDFLSKAAMDLAPPKSESTDRADRGGAKPKGTSAAERLLADRKGGDAGTPPAAEDGGADHGTDGGDAGPEKGGGLADQLRKVFKKDD